MEFVRTDGIPKRNSYRTGKIQTLLLAFAEQPEDMMEVIVDEKEYTNIESARTSIKQSANRPRMPIKTKVVYGRLFVLKGVRE